MFPRGVVYIVNKIGPSTEPWGTPYFNVTGVDVHDPIWTVCVRSLRYDSNHLRATPLIPKDWFNRFNNFWWSMVSNAALKSSSTKMAPPSLSTAWSRSFCTQRSATVSGPFPHGAVLHCYWGHNRQWRQIKGSFVVWDLKTLLLEWDPLSEVCWPPLATLTFAVIWCPI